MRFDLAYLKTLINVKKSTRILNLTNYTYVIYESKIHLHCLIFISLTKSIMNAIQTQSLLHQITVMYFLLTHKFN